MTEKDIITADENKEVSVKNEGNDTELSTDVKESPSEKVLSENTEDNLSEGELSEAKAETISAKAAPPIDGNKVLRRQRRKRILGYSAFILLNALVIAVMLIVEDKSGDAATGKAAFIRLGENPLFTVLAFSMFFVIVIFDSIVFKTLISKTGVKHRAGLAIKVSFLGRYYDRITPWAMGGEPFQMAYLIHGGLDAGQSCSVAMSRHVIRFFSTAVVVITILIASRISTNVWVMAAAIASVLAGLIIPVFMLICAFRPALGQKIGRGVIGFLHKIKIVKNYDKQMKKMQEEVDKFLKGIKYLSGNKQVIAIIALASIVELFANNSVPYFVMRALGYNELTYWHTLVLCIFVTYASSFAPTPGGAGIAELSFYAIFASVIGGGYLFWAVLFWRIAVFYVPVFIGFVMQTADSLYSIVSAGKKR